MALKCTFEKFGRHDGVVETVEENPQVVAIAEWEWNCDDIFGEGKELEKIWKSLQKFETAHGILLTYCSDIEYDDLARKVVEYWMTELRNSEEDRRLYLIVVHLVESDSKLEIGEYVSTITIQRAGVLLWDNIVWEL